MAAVGLSPSSRMAAEQVLLTLLGIIDHPPAVVGAQLDQTNPERGFVVSLALLADVPPHRFLRCVCRNDLHTGSTLLADLAQLLGPAGGSTTSLAPTTQGMGLFKLGIAPVMPYDSVPGRRLPIKQLADLFRYAGSRILFLPHLKHQLRSTGAINFCPSHSSFPVMPLRRNRPDRYGLGPCVSGSFCGSPFPGVCRSNRVGAGTDDPTASCRGHIRSR